MEIVEVNRASTEQAIIYRRNKTKKIKLPDAIILATAKFINADLLTGDWDDFQGLDDSLRILNLDDLRV